MPALVASPRRDRALLALSLLCVSHLPASANHFEMIYLFSDALQSSPRDEMSVIQFVIAGSRSMIHATADLFDALCGQHIAVTTAGGTESWRVVSVKRHPPHALRSDPPFSAYLLAPIGNDRQQGMRASTLPNGEPFEFFAVPVTATADGVSYELVFN